MLNLTYTQQPENGDKGSVFWPVLALLFSKFDDHTHDATNSDKISCKNVLKDTQTIPNGDLSLDTNGLYKATVDMTLATSGLTFDNTLMKFTVTAAVDAADVGSEFFPTVLKLTSTTFKVWVMGDATTFAFRIDYR